MPPNVLYAALSPAFSSSDGGIFRSDDVGASGLPTFFRFSFPLGESGFEFPVHALMIMIGETPVAMIRRRCAIARLTRPEAQHQRELV